MSYTDLLVKIINIQKSKPLKFSLIMKEKQYKLNDVTMSKKNTVVSKKTVRGGVYISDKFVYQLKATVSEPRMATMLSGTMLGPNFDFDALDDLQFEDFSDLEAPPPPSEKVDINLDVDVDEDSLYQQKVAEEVGAAVLAAEGNYDELFGDKYSNVIPEMWMPNWSDATDPSARELEGYSE